MFGFPIIANGATHPAVALMSLSSRAADAYDWDLRLKVELQTGVEPARSLRYQIESLGTYH